MRIKLVAGYIVGVLFLFFIVSPFALITIEMLLTSWMYKTVELFAYYRVLQGVILIFYTNMYLMFTEVIKIGRNRLESREKT